MSSHPLPHLIHQLRPLRLQLSRHEALLLMRGLLLGLPQAGLDMAR